MIHNIIFLLFVIFQFAGTKPATGYHETPREGALHEQVEIKQWQPHVFGFTAAQQHSWKDFLLQVTFTPPASHIALVLDAYWDGAKTWKVRFTPTKPGLWHYSTSSCDKGLGQHEGDIRCISPDHDAIKANSNYQGKVKVEPGKQYFEYADGTPVLLLAEQLWDFNVSSWMPVSDSLANNVDAHLPALWGLYG